MSRIYFHTPSETVEVYGSERARLSQLIRKVTTCVFDLMSWERKRELLPKDWQHGYDRLGISLKIDRDFSLLLGGDENFSDGQEIFSTTLNTILQIGSRPMQLAARIHAQCEIHGYVEPEDGEFIAALIEEGLKIGIFREHLPLDSEHATGWREVCRVLRSGEIVVSSYSVCEGFPNQSVAAEGGAYQIPTCDACVGTGEPNLKMKYQDVDYDHCTSCDGGKLWDAWYDLSEQERWDRGVQALRTGIQGLRWGRENWDDFYFGNGKTAFDYINPVSAGV